VLQGEGLSQTANYTKACMLKKLKQLPRWHLHFDAWNKVVVRFDTIWQEQYDAAPPYFGPAEVGVCSLL
jgi:hypothetical protein